MLRLLQKAGLMHCTKCYVDDIVIHSKTAAAHQEHVRAVLQVLVESGFKAHPEKSLFMTDTMESFWGSDVSSHGLTHAEAKIKAFKELRYPATVEECMTVLGKLRYYGYFCEHFSEMAEPLAKHSSGTTCTRQCTCMSTSATKAWELYSTRLAAMGLNTW